MQQFQIVVVAFELSAGSANPSQETLRGGHPGKPTPVPFSKSACYDLDFCFQTCLPYGPKLSSLNHSR